MFGSGAAGEPGLVALRDAQAAAYAADGCCRASGAPAAVLAVGAAQAMQVASALVTAWSDRLPVAVLTRDVPGPERPAVRQALEAVTEPRGPFHVELAPGESVAAALAAISLPRAAGAEVDPTGVREAARLLRQSRRPLVLLGRGACGIDPALAAELSQRADCPVLLTASATTMPAAALEGFRRAFAERGALLPSGNLVWVKALAQADGILALGAALSEVDWFGLSSLQLARARLLRVALEPADPELAQTFVRAGAGAFLGRLLEQLPAMGSGKGAAHWRQAAGGWRDRIEREARAHAGLPHVEPALAARAIVEGADDATLFVSEGGACGMWLWSYLWLRPLIFPVQHGTIGVPLPMALGALTAHPDRPVWCVVGDGAFFYHAAELSTLREAGLAPAIFVFNDGCWSAIRLAQTAVFGGRYVGTDLAETDYAALAALHGGEGLTVRRPGELDGAIRRARDPARRVPLVVDIRLPRDHVPYAGASFVLAELDGVLASLLPGSLLGAGRGLLRGTLPLSTLRSILRVSRS